MATPEPSPAGSGSPGVPSPQSPIGPAAGSFSGRDGSAFRTSGRRYLPHYKGWMRDQLAHRYFDPAHAILAASVDIDLPEMEAAVARLSIIVIGVVQ